MKNKMQNNRKKIIVVFMIFIMLSSYLPSFNFIAQAVSDITEIPSDTTGEIIDEDEEINITDEKLKEYFLSNYDKDGNGKMTKSEMEEITYFSYLSYDSNIIIDLDSLKYCTNLISLYIHGEYFTNTEVIKELKKIENIYLELENISIVEELPNLKYLCLENVNLSNLNWDKISKNLTDLYLKSCELEDINFIIKFENLTDVILLNNKIKDLSPLKQLKNLDTIYVDFSEENADIIEEMPVKNVLCRQNIELKDLKVEKGKILEIDVPLIGKKVLDKNSKLYSENIEYYSIIQNYDRIRINNEKTKIIIDATNLDIGNYSDSNFCLGSTHAGASFEISYSVYEGVDEKKEIEINDIALKKYLIENYDYDSDGIITNLDMLQITHFIINNSEIKDLSCLEYAKNIKTLSLNWFSGDISIISKLNKLETLNFTYVDGVKDLTCLKELKNLKIFHIYDSILTDNDIDIKTISELTQLTDLQIQDSNYDIEIDVNKIANLTNLFSLGLIGKLSNIDIIGEKFTNLTSLHLQTKNVLENIEFVSKLTNLTTLNLEDNNINDITPLKGLEKLENVYLKKNPINTKELNNAETLQLLRSRGTYVSVSETNSTRNLDFKDIEFKNALIKDGKDLNKDNEISISEMENISHLNITNMGIINSIEEIEYAKNLNSISINSTNIEDLSPILKLKDNIAHFNMSGKITDKNFETIAKLTTLTSLSISNNYLNNEKTEMLDLNGIENLTNLTSLSLSGYINLEKCEELSNSINLTNLNISIYTNNYENPYYFDLKGIDKFTKLNRLSLSSSILNIEEIKKLENLEYLNIFSSVYDLNKNKIPTDKVMTLLDELNIKETSYYNFNENINLGNIIQGTTTEISLKDIEILKNFIDKNSIFYDPNINISVNSYTDAITFDKEQQKIILDITNLGENHAYINISSRNTSGNITIDWRNYIQGDAQKEINIPDTNLKNRLLAFYDIDDDSKITENDIINIVELYVESYGISNKIKSIEGLQYAINLSRIDLSWNNVSDLTPIINLENIKDVYATGNFITDVRFLNNVKWKNASCWFSTNFIDFNDNENYLALKNYCDKSEDLDEFRKTEIMNATKHQRDGKLSEIDNVVNFEENLKNALIEYNVDENKDGQITRRELYYMDSAFYDIDLSNLNITNISGLEYITVSFIDLSNNNISDITPLTKNYGMYYIDLSNNNISDISGIEKIRGLTTIKLAHNNIENIEPLTNLENMQGTNGYSYRNLDIDLSSNKISDITCVKNWKCLYRLNLSNNRITDISSLKDYNFKVDGEYEYAEELTIDLSGNDINLTDSGNKAAKEVFDNKGANLKLIDTSKAKLYVLDKNGIFTEENNLGSINTEFSVDNTDYEFVSEKNRTYYPEGSDSTLVGIFLNSEYYNSSINEIKQKGFDKEIVVTGAIKTRNNIFGTEYLTAELTVPEGYIGSTAEIGTLNNAEIIERTRNTIKIKMLLNSDPTDSNYLSFNASILLKEKEQVLDDITNKEEIINHINGEHDVTLDMTTDIVEVSNEVFETLAEKEDLKLKVETENAVWSFSSDTIENTDITLNPKVQISDSRFEDMSEGGVEDGIFIKFEHEGALPGKAEIELDVSNCNKYEDGKTIYLYYFDSEKNTFKYISTTRSENNIVKITLEHCSEYVLTEELLYVVGDVNQDGKITLADYTKILAHVKKTQLLTEHALLAADVNGDGKVTLADYTKVLAHVKKTQLLY